METRKTNRKDVERRPRSYRRREWDSFQDLVGHYVECHAVPKHGDFPMDNVTNERVESLIKKIRALAERFGMKMLGRVTHGETKQQPGSYMRKDDLRDLMRIAHLAGMAYFKLAQVVETAELRRTFRFCGTDIFIMARRYGDMWVTDCPHPVHEIGSSASLAFVDLKEGTFFCPTCKWSADLMPGEMPLEQPKSSEWLRINSRRPGRLRGQSSLHVSTPDGLGSSAFNEMWMGGYDNGAREWKREMICQPWIGYDVGKKEPWTEYGTTGIRRGKKATGTPDE